MRSRRGLAAAGIVIAISAAGCGTSQAPKPPAAALTTPVTPAASSALAAAASPAPDNPWADWCTGAGYTDLQAVVTDLQTVTADDTGNVQVSTIEADGQNILIDAARSELNPPPESRSQAAAYQAWMKQAGLVGAAWAQYDLASVTYAARASQRYAPAVKAATDKCTAMGAP